MSHADHEDMIVAELHGTGDPDGETVGSDCWRSTTRVGAKCEPVSTDHETAKRLARLKYARQRYGIAPGEPVVAFFFPQPAIVVRVHVLDGEPVADVESRGRIHEAVPIASLQRLDKWGEGGSKWN